MPMTAERYFFEHLLTCEAAYGALLDHNRRLLHRAAAEIYERELVPGSAQEWDLLPALAAHLRAAGEYLAAHQRYCDSLLLMAQTGRYQAWDETLRSAQACWDNFAATRQEPFRRSARQLHCLGSRAYAEGRFDAAWIPLEEALGLARSEDDTALEGLLLTALGAVQQRKGDLPQAQELYLLALPLLERIGNLPAQSQVQRSLAILNRDSARPAQAQEHSLRALELAQRCENPRLEAQVRIALGNESKMYRTFAEAGGHMARGYELACTTGDVETQSACLAGLAEVHLLQGSFALAATEAQQALVLARATGNPRSISFTLNVLGAALGYGGSTMAARAVLQESQDISTAAGHAWGQALTLQYLGRLERICGDIQQACEYDRRCGELARQLGHHALAAAMRTRSAEFLLGSRDLQPLRAAIEADRPAWMSLGTMWRILPISVSIRTSVLEGDLASAQAELEQALAECAEYHSFSSSLPLQELRLAREELNAAQARVGA